MVGTRLVLGPAGGVIGFRYEAIYPLLDRMATDPEHWKALLFDLEVIERAALKEINAKH